MLGYEDFEEKTIARKEIFKGNIIDVYLDDVALPQGGTSQRELVFHPGGVGILAITPDNKIVLVKQFRKPLEKVILEIGRGKELVNIADGSKKDILDRKSEISIPAYGYIIYRKVSK